jgi:hypothetical protein
MNQGSTSNVLRNVNLFRVLGYILVFLMTACAVMTLSMLIQNVLPGWHSGVIAGILLFIVIDRLYTYRSVRSLTPLSSEWAISIGGQWILILLVMRFLLSYADGLDSLRADLASFARGDIAELFTLEFITSFLLALLMWFFCGRFLDLLDEIGLDPVLALNEDSAPIGEAVPAHQRLVGMIFSIGIGLVILTAVARVDMQSFASDVQGLPRIELNSLSGAEAGALLYFVFGLALLSLSRLMSLQTHWNRLRIPVASKNLTRQWGIYSLLFLLLLAVVVSLLPAGDSFGLFSVLATLLNFLFGILFFLGQLIIGLLLLLVSLPFALFGQGLPSILPSAPPPLPVLPPVGPVVPPSSNTAWAFLRSVFLWGVLALIAVFAIVQFVRGHGGLRAALRKSRLTSWLAMAWQWLSRNVNPTGAELSRALSEGWQNLLARLEERRILPAASLLRLRALDPRRQVYFFYLAMVRRGGEQGMPRKPAQTPSEYAATLDRALPEAQEDIDAITRAFVEARYSRREIAAQDASEVRTIWGRIRRALQQLRKGEERGKR